MEMEMEWDSISEYSIWVNESNHKSNGGEERRGEDVIDASIWVMMLLSWESGKQVVTLGMFVRSYVERGVEWNESKNKMQSTNKKTKNEKFEDDDKNESRLIYIFATRVGFIKPCFFCVQSVHHLLHLYIPLFFL